jgi:hypothetical protein
MISDKDQYIETTNLYWEMLWKAQKVEDKNLVALIRKRLTELPVKKQTMVASCLIIPFPLPQRPVPQLQDTAHLFWPTQPLPSTLSFIAGYCFFIFACIFTNMA